ncbi:tetraacyldisaccharide 4'-kinase [Aliishimia ponticola]|uniref:Tetraacyldisaccharide 4'-kinase n=1 Tax=Aliishimia ponticola TaxID=2499833 RepID=A0A4S4NBB3_9RHOB|nr:tetraacyldisaccharide 4'-kinase [Aliishimia ponticola]THH36609.1 tetraacyldisaccharide 4'-kinase [Aliishimia ponticola]
MREPAFWSDPSDIRSRLLAPIGALYARATARRLAGGAKERLDIPVICVGNINAGGTGKTPVTIALAERLRDLGHRPHVVSRGYGGTLTGPVHVDPARHKASEVGDEPLLISAFADVWVAKDRGAGGRAAQEAGASVIVLDDGFQNPALEQDLKIVVVDAQRGFGNGRCIPAGPLREPLATGLARADALVTVGDATVQRQFDTPLPADLPRLAAELKPLQTGMDWTGQPWLAFAGIGHPEKFFNTLRKLGATLALTVPLDDHEPLTPGLLTRLERDALAAGAQLVTTEKDAARLPRAWRGKVLTLPVRLHFDDEDQMKALLAQFPAP